MTQGWVVLVVPSFCTDDLHSNLHCQKYVYLSQFKVCKMESVQTCHESINLEHLELSSAMFCYSCGYLFKVEYF